MSLKKKKITFPSKRTYFITNEEEAVFKTILDDATNFPKKLARANEVLKKAKLLPPLTKK